MDYCDEASRDRSNKDGDWPKETPKPNKRAIAFGWFTDQKMKKESSVVILDSGSRKKQAVIVSPSSNSITMTGMPNKSPEPTAVGAVRFRCRGSRRESAVAQLFSLGHIEFLDFIESVSLRSDS